MIVMMGGQGVGKGTLSKKLIEHHPYKYIETGALLRALPDASPLKKIIERGDLVPDDNLFELLESKITPEHDIILDGFPRKTTQAQWLIDKYSTKFKIHVIYLNVSEEIMIARIKKRLTEIGGRTDDTDAAVIRHRLDNFWTVTKPAIEWLRNTKNIIFSDLDVSNPDIETNYKKVLNALEQKNAK